VGWSRTLVDFALALYAMSGLYCTHYTGVIKGAYLYQREEVVTLQSVIYSAMVAAKELDSAL
jgi:hypothetical protein